MSMSMKTEPELLSQIEGGADAIAHLSTYDRQLVAEDTTAHSERRGMLGAEAPGDDAIAAMERTVDGISAEYGRMHARAILGSFSEEMLEQKDGTFKVRRVKCWSPSPFEGRFRLEDLIGIAPGLVKDFFRKAITAAAPAGTGITLAEKQRQLPILDARIRAIEDRHDLLVATAARVGITIKRLPACQARADAAAAKAQRDAADTRARLAAEAAVNAALSRPAPGSGQTSRYLVDGGVDRERAEIVKDSTPFHV